MSAPRITDEALKKTIALVAEHGGQTAAALATGVPLRTIQNHMKWASQRGLNGFSPVIPGFEITQISSGPKGEFIQQRREAGGVFELPKDFLVKHISANVDSDMRLRQQWIKADLDHQHSAEVLRTIADELKKELPRIAPTKGPVRCNSLLLNQYTVTDLHFGMLAWGEETGGDDYDLKIAEKLLVDWFSAAIAMSPDAGTGIFAQLGDLMHHDAHESETPAHKHVLDADSRLQKIIRVVIRVVRQILAMLLQKHDRVHIIMASANHDPASSAWMRELLHSMYEDEPRITVDDSPDVYYAFDWGNTALFYHHGHKRKLENVDSTFVGKFRQLYGRAEYSYGHVGHLHDSAVRESNLMLVERHRTLAPADAYTAGGGWLSKRDAKVITYSKLHGEVSRITLSPQMLAVAA